MLSHWFFTALLWLWTDGVRHNKREAQRSPSEENAPLCLPGTQCSYHVARIQSPNYPHSYPANQDVYWFLKVTKNVSVEAAVFTVEKFQVQEGHDWVTLGVSNHMDRTTVRKALSGILQQGQTYTIDFSFGSQVYVHFHSDNTIQDTGFVLSYRLRLAIALSPPALDLRVTEVEEGSVFLSWMPIAASAGYRVHIVTESSERVIVSQACYITLETLEHGTNYTITVSPTNGHGKGHVTVQLPPHRPGHRETTVTPALSQGVTGSVRHGSALLRLPECRVFQRVAEQLWGRTGSGFSIYVLVAEEAVGWSQCSVPHLGGEAATHRGTEAGHRGVYVAEQNLPLNKCFTSEPGSGAHEAFGIYQLGSVRECPLSGICNGQLRSNTSYRVRYMLVNNRTSILCSSWSKPFSTIPVIPFWHIQSQSRGYSPGECEIMALPVLLFLLLISLLGIGHWRCTRTDQPLKVRITFTASSLKLSESALSLGGQHNEGLSTTGTV
eukprot:gi/632953568/ref/XP_007892488.1/ PREDICTED: uncharacterized protein LOC103179165 [Callorhinchus milii]